MYRSSVLCKSSFCEALDKCKMKVSGQDQQSQSVNQLINEKYTKHSVTCINHDSKKQKHFTNQSDHLSSNDCVNWIKLVSNPIKLVLTITDCLPLRSGSSKDKTRHNQMRCLSSSSSSHSKILIVLVLFFLNFFECIFETWNNIAVEIKLYLFKNNNLSKQVDHILTSPSISRGTSSQKDELGHINEYLNEQSDMINPSLDSSSNIIMIHDRDQYYPTERLNMVKKNPNSLVMGLENLYLSDQNRPPTGQKTIYENPMSRKEHGEINLHARRTAQMSARSTTVDGSNWVSSSQAFTPRIFNNYRNDKLTWQNHMNLESAELGRYSSIPTTCINCREHDTFFPLSKPSIQNIPMRVDKASSISKDFGYSTRYHLGTNHISHLQDISIEKPLHSGPSHGLLITDTIGYTNRIHAVSDSVSGSDGELLLTHKHRHHHPSSRNTDFRSRRAVHSTEPEHISYEGITQRSDKSSEHTESSSERVRVRPTRGRSLLTPEKLSLAGARRRLGFRKKGLTKLSVHRSEEVIPNEAKLLFRQATVGSFPDPATKKSHSNVRNQQPSPSRMSPEFGTSFVEGLGNGQVVSRQALVSPNLGDIQLSISDHKGVLEVEVIRARGLHPKAGAPNLPSPYVKIYLMRNKICIAKFKTDLVKETLDPLYQKKIVFRGDYKGCIIQIIVWGYYNRKDPKSLMGIAQIHTNELDISNLVGWYKLFHMPSLEGVMHSSRTLRCKLLSYDGNNSEDNKMKRCNSQPV